MSVPKTPSSDDTIIDGHAGATAPPVFHVTVLSNLARAYDKYRRAYCKSRIPESRYPREFYVLEPSDVGVGIDKATRLLARLGVRGDEMVALEARLPRSELRPHPRGGPGAVWPSSDLPIHRVHRIVAGELAPTTIEEAIARSLGLGADAFVPYLELRPRSLSFLPVARACQAACPFCFSRASASDEQQQERLEWPTVERWIRAAMARGAERAVITGGGEPTLLSWPSLVALTQRCAAKFSKVVLITNGFVLATCEDPVDRLYALHGAGLSVLAISRHHWEEAANTRLMNLETRAPALLETVASSRDHLRRLRVRLVCVLQQGGVESLRDVDEYVRWAVQVGADEVCFKELYVSTSLESVYHSRAANEWSARHQVPLELVLAWAARRKALRVASLPWGAPIFEARIDGRTIRVTAYTEPSLFWERSNGIARSWNIMADGTCLASLEDRASAVATPPEEVGS